MNQTKISRVIRRMTLVHFAFRHLSPSGNFTVLDRPEVPVGHFPVELLIQFGGIQRLFPGALQLHEIAEWVGCRQLAQGKIMQYFDVSAVRAGGGNILDQGDFLEDILTRIAFMSTGG